VNIISIKKNLSVLTAGVVGIVLGVTVENIPKYKIIAYAAAFTQSIQIYDYFLQFINKSCKKQTTVTTH